MGATVFVAGATGVVGRPLCRLLLDAGWRVVGSTRTPGKAAALHALGVEPALLDVFDAAAVARALAEASPEAVIHQLTDLPDGLDPAQMDEGRKRNARIRELGTRNLVAAAVDAGVRRMVAQSIAFVYQEGAQPYTEEAPLMAGADAVRSLEKQVLEATLDGLILRYGRFYGPGTGFDVPSGGSPVHVEAAAHAAFLALTRGSPGIYNIAEDDGTVSSEKAVRLLGWSPQLRVPRART